MSADITVRRDLGSWIVRARTLNGRAVLAALDIEDGSTVYGHGHLAILRAAQDAGLIVSDEG